MGTSCVKAAHGYTIVELLVTILIVTIFAASVGMLAVKLLTLHEKNREDAYVREKLLDICAIYADYLSLGSSIGTNNFETIVKYRMETGGVSFETGVVSHVTHLISALNPLKKTVDLGTYTLKDGNMKVAKSFSWNGDASLIVHNGNMFARIVGFMIRPLRYTGDPELTWTADGGQEELTGEPVSQMTDAAFGYLELTAQYQSADDNRLNTVRAGRLVRLWNWKAEK